MVFGDGLGRAVSDLLPRLGSRRAWNEGMIEGSAAPLERVAVFPTKVLSRFLVPLSELGAPVIVDLGTAVGSTVTFLGEKLGCKLFVDDLLADLGPVLDEDPDIPDPDIGLRLAHPDASVDGVLCWDVLEYFGPEAARGIAREVVRVLRPNGVVFLCRVTDPGFLSTQTTYEIVDEGQLRYRGCQRAREKQRVLQNREMTKLFEALTIVDSVLLANRMSEMVFRKHSGVTGGVPRYRVRH